MILTNVTDRFLEFRVDGIEGDKVTFSIIFMNTEGVKVKNTHEVDFKDNKHLLYQKGRENIKVQGIKSL